MQDVEDLEHRWLRVSGVATEAGAKPGEVRPSVAAEAHQLTIERHPVPAQHTAIAASSGNSSVQLRPVLVRTETARPS